MLMLYFRTFKEQIMHNKGPEYELELIKKVQKSADGIALQELCELYRPMINAVKSKYFLKLYDEQDWDQEAMIVCYQSAMDFLEKRGNFSSYFKRRLNNHAISILRYQLSQRRKADNDSVSWDNLLLTEGSVHEPKTLSSHIPNSIVYDEWVSKLSDLELTALLISLGKIDEEFVKRSLNLDQQTINRARFRAFKKIRQTLFE